MWVLGGGGGRGAFRIVSDWHCIFKYKAGLDTDYRCFRNSDPVRERERERKKKKREREKKHTPTHN